MSRFISSYKRLARKVSLLEMAHLSDNLGPALIAYHKTGELPEQPWLRERVRWSLAVAHAMRDTMPGMPSEEQGQEL
jgi:hypothetical protein